MQFREQIVFFLRKANIPTQAWTDLWQADHDTGFMVAGAAKAELLQDLREAVQAAIVDGESIQQFRKRFDDIVERHGWAYNGGRNWRTRVIYQTNLRTSYSAGRWAQLTSDAGRKAFPYWRYRHSHLDKVPRPLHIAPPPVGLNGLVLRADNPIWRVIWTPNGWGCTCYIEGVSQRLMDELGKTGPDPDPTLEYHDVTVGSRGSSPRTVSVPEGIDPGFAYAPGASIEPQVRAWVQELLQYELNSDYATALAKFIANTPPAPPPPEPALDVDVPDDQEPDSAPSAGSKKRGSSLLLRLLRGEKSSQNAPPSPDEAAP